MTTHDHNNTNGQDSNENIINLPAQNAKKDPAGTDPNRYGYFSSDKNTSRNKNSDEDDDYNQKPKNHTTTDERLLNPDRGEE